MEKSQNTIAVILIGGYGTRFRPLTFNKPKCLVEFINTPIIEHQIRSIAESGICDIIIASTIRDNSLKPFIHELNQKYNVLIECVQEDEPLGTFGGLKNSTKKLFDRVNYSPNPRKVPQRIFVFNSDIICDFPLDQMIQKFEETSCLGVMALTKVDNPQNYGVATKNPDGLITDFVEKPKNYAGQIINAGFYLFHPDVLKLLQDEGKNKASIEIDLIPELIKLQKLTSIQLTGTWTAIGSAGSYLKAMRNHLHTLFLKKDTSLEPPSKDKIVGNVVIHPSAKISKDAHLGPNVVIGPDCVISDGVKLQNCAILEGCIIKANTWISESIIGWRSNIGKWVRIEGITVVGEDVIIADELYLNSSFILPHKTLTESLPTKQSMVMQRSCISKIQRFRHPPSRLIPLQDNQPYVTKSP